MLRTALFIDGPNLFASAKQLGFDVDYSKLRQVFDKSTILMRAYYYTALLEDASGRINLYDLVTWLSFNGYTVITKDAKEYVQTDGSRKVKGNMDVEFTIDVLTMAPKVDQIILFTGDGDFRYLVETVKKMGVLVTVVSTISTSPIMCADILRREADRFIELATLRSVIARSN